MFNSKEEIKNKDLFLNDIQYMDTTIPLLQEKY